MLQLQIIVQGNLRSNLVCIFFLFANSLSFGCKREIKSEFILPYRFKGNVAIIYSNTHLSKKENGNNPQQFIIPSTGILFTNENYKEGVLKEHFYSISKFKKLSEVKEYSFEKDSGNSYIFFDRIVTFDCNNKDDKSIAYTVRLFCISNKADSIIKNEQYLFQKHVELLCGCN